MSNFHQFISLSNFSAPQVEALLLNIFQESFGLRVQDG